MLPDLQPHLDALNSDEAFTREQAKKALVSYGSDAVPALLNLLAHGEGRARWLSVKVLAEIGDTRAIPALLQALDSGNPIISQTAAQGLGAFYHPDVINGMIHYLKTRDTDITPSHIWLAEALGKFHAKEAVDVLLVLVRQTPSSTLRHVAIHALGEIGDASATVTDTLTQYLNDENHHVRERAEQALKKLASPPNDLSTHTPK